MEHEPSVDILLSTYNGESYLAQQLDSILSQSYSRFRLLVRDDGSTDHTVEICADYASANSRVQLALDDLGNIGSKRSFGELLSRSGADLVFFADQDDVWLEDKVRLFLNTYETCDPCVPLLAHSDLTIVDRDLRVVASSMARFQRLPPCEGEPLGRLAVQNVITGCATMINRTLKDLATFIPEEAIMHDWWLALLAAATGTITYIPHHTVLYRQHSGNILGAKRYSLCGARNLCDWERMTSSVRATMRQAMAMARLVQVSPEKRRVLETWGSFCELPVTRRAYCLWRYGFFKRGFLRNLAFVPIAVSIRPIR